MYPESAACFPPAHPPAHPPVRPPTLPPCCLPACLPCAMRQVLDGQRLQQADFQEADDHQLRASSSSQQPQQPWEGAVEAEANGWGSVPDGGEVLPGAAGVGGGGQFQDVKGSLTASPSRPSSREQQQQQQQQQRAGEGGGAQTPGSGPVSGSGRPPLPSGGAGGSGAGAERLSRTGSAGSGGGCSNGEQQQQQRPLSGGGRGGNGSNSSSAGVLLPARSPVSTLRPSTAPAPRPRGTSACAPLSPPCAADAGGGRQGGAGSPGPSTALYSSDYLNDHPILLEYLVRWWGGGGVCMCA